MDPDAMYAEMLELADDLLHRIDEDDAIEGSTAEAALRLAELVWNLNEWRRKGGFLPKALATE